MKKFVKNLIIASILFLVVAGFFSLTLGDDRGAKEVTLSQVASQVQNGEVDKIQVSENRVLIFLKNGEKEIGIKEAGSTLPEILQSLGVTAEAIKNLNYEAKGPSGASVFFGNILPFLLPFLLIGGVFYFFFRPGFAPQKPAPPFWRSHA